jgi:hypothetical protein
MRIDIHDTIASFSLTSLNNSGRRHPYKQFHSSGCHQATQREYAAMPDHSGMSQAFPEHPNQKYLGVRENHP